MCARAAYIHISPVSENKKQKKDDIPSPISQSVWGLRNPSPPKDCATRENFKLINSTPRGGRFCEKNSPRRVYLVAHLPEAKIAFDWVAQRTAFETRAAPIDDDDDVLQATREIRVPVDVERSAHELRAGPTISVIRRDKYGKSAQGFPLHSLHACA